MRTSLVIFILFLAFFVTYGKNPPRKIYRNPVIAKSTPDPTIIRSEDGTFYLYATEDIRNMPIYKSTDLVHWDFAGTVFTPKSRPTFEKGGLWAPDINFINGKYVLYYSLSKWGGEQTCGIGCAISDSPEGPFTDQGKLFRSNEIGVQNSIDPFYIEEEGNKYLFWGSFRGIYFIELSDDGLSVRAGSKPTKIAGTAYEATYIHKKGKYYYFFASIGSCCRGDKSTYTTVVGRSESLFGPYLDKNGNNMLDNHHEIVLQANTRFVGTGHNAEIVTDKKGRDSILYHAYMRGEKEKGRVLMLDRIHWEKGWPTVKNGSPSFEAKAPAF